MAKKRTGSSTTQMLRAAEITSRGRLVSSPKAGAGREPPKSPQRLRRVLLVLALELPALSKASVRSCTRTERALASALLALAVNVTLTGALPAAPKLAEPPPTTTALPLDSRRTLAVRPSRISRDRTWQASEQPTRS
jgi:hypothetical protein